MLSRIAHPYHLSLAAPMVFLLGVPTIFLTRFVFHATRPEYFADTIPTISKSAAFAPASDVFLIGILVVSTCIVMAWLLVFRMSRERLQALAGRARHARLYRTLSAAAAGFGILAGICLALLAIITLEVQDPVHIALSYAFFITQLSAYLADSWAAWLMNRMLAAEDAGPGLSLGGKPVVCLATILLGLFYLFLFLTREKGLYPNEMLVQGIYVMTEYVLSTLCFAYSALYFPELRRHFRASLETLH